MFENFRSRKITRLNFEVSIETFKATEISNLSFNPRRLMGQIEIQKMIKLKRGHLLAGVFERNEFNGHR